MASHSLGTGLIGAHSEGTVLHSRRGLPTYWGKENRSDVISRTGLGTEGDVRGGGMEGRLGYRMELRWRLGVE